MIYLGDKNIKPSVQHKLLKVLPPPPHLRSPRLRSAGHVWCESCWVLYDVAQKIFSKKERKRERGEGRKERKRERERRKEKERKKEKIKKEKGKISEAL